MRILAAFLVTTALAIASPVLAEGSGHPNTGEGDAAEAAAKPRPVRKAKPKPKPSIPAPKIPDAPIPYTALSAGTPLSPDMAKALTPGPVAPSPEHHAEAAPATATHVEPTTVPAPPAPVQVAVAPPPPPPPPRPSEAVVEINPLPAEINLKCETTTTRGKKTVSTGVFYIAIVPSAIFPDEEASFQFRFVDPAHRSLIRDTVCLDIGCQARVSPSTYSLINMTTKHGDALRITLDRARGSFYAEAIDDKMVGRTAHLGEQGWCKPEPMASKVLF